MALTSAACPSVLFVLPPQPETVDPTTISEADVFNLHSRPAATKKIYLNFKGAILKNTAWNSGSDITVPPYSADTNTAAFSATELSNMYAIWRGVSEDYAFADVDVTTQVRAPGQQEQTSLQLAGVVGKGCLDRAARQPQQAPT